MFWIKDSQNTSNRSNVHLLCNQPQVTPEVIEDLDLVLNWSASFVSDQPCQKLNRRVCQMPQPHLWPSAPAHLGKLPLELSGSGFDWNFYLGIENIHKQTDDGELRRLERAIIDVLVIEMKGTKFGDIYNRSHCEMFNVNWFMLNLIYVEPQYHWSCCCGRVRHHQACN